jgi:ABC-type phosphate/phosphonate transport system substrate-binding protein
MVERTEISEDLSMRHLYAALIIACGLFALLSVPSHEVSAQGKAAALQVGMPQTFFHDVPPVLIKFATEPFSKVIRDATGMSGELLVGVDAFAVARDLIEKKLQLAVFHSFEFGWVQLKHPELRPLMVAVNSQRSVSAYVFVREDSSYKSFTDLKGKEFSLPKKTREHCRIFVEQQCQYDAACGSKAFFGQVVRSANVEKAMDDVCLGKLDAVVVDAIGVEFYKDLKPGCFDRLRKLPEQVTVPPPVIAYCEGVLDAKTMSLLRSCLQNAHSTPMGAEMMKMWKITSFDPVPANYADAVNACIKTYPCPSTK